MLIYDDVSKKYQVPSQSIAVFYPEKSMIGIISPSTPSAITRL